MLRQVIVTTVFQNSTKNFFDPPYWGYFFKFWGGENVIGLIFVIFFAFKGLIYDCCSFINQAKYFFVDIIANS